MEVINPEGKTEADIIEELVAKRTPYAPMHAHMEMAAMALAAGGTFRMAAAYSGVGVRQIRQYLERPSFRTRIEELRSIMMSRIRGKVLKELDRRTTGQNMRQMELLDVLRIFDRMNGGVGGKPGLNIGEVNVTNNNYDTILAALVASDSGTQGVNFPELLIDGSAVSDPDPSE